MILSLLLVSVVVGLFITIIYFAITSERKRKKKKQETLLSLGFHPVRELDSGLLDTLKLLYQKRDHQKLELKEFYTRKTGDYDIFLYEVWDNSGNDTDLQDAWGLAIQSPYLDLPRFTLVPRIDMPGKFASLANRFIEHLVSKQAHKIVFDQYVPFSKRYMVVGENESAIRQFFSDRVLDRLSETEYWQVDADHHLFTYSQFEFKRGKQPGNLEQLNQRLENIKNLFQLFSQG